MVVGVELEGLHEASGGGEFAGLEAQEPGLAEGGEKDRDEDGDDGDDDEEFDEREGAEDRALGAGAGLFPS